MVPALAAIMLVGMLAAVTPGQSVTAYEMYGFGAIAVDTGSGMQACAGHAGQSVGGNCPPADTTTTWKFTSLTVNGHGQLGSKLVNGGYDCAGSNSNVTTKGHTGNFQLTWIFDCHKISGDGWGHIVGVFTNNPSQNCVGGPCKRGTFLFAGSFDGCDSHTNGPNPDGCPGGDAKVPMNCTAAFQPTAFAPGANPLTGTSITGVAFQGECTAAIP